MALRWWHYPSELEVGGCRVERERGEGLRGLGGIRVVSFGARAATLFREDRVKSRG